MLRGSSSLACTLFWRKRKQLRSNQELARSDLLVSCTLWRLQQAEKLVTSQNRNNKLNSRSMSREPWETTLKSSCSNKRSSWNIKRLPQGQRWCTSLPTMAVEAGKERLSSKNSVCWASFKLSVLFSPPTSRAILTWKCCKATSSTRTFIPRLLISTSLKLTESSSSTWSTWKTRSENQSASSVSLREQRQSLRVFAMSSRWTSSTTTMVFHLSTRRQNKWFKRSWTPKGKQGIWPS